MEKQSRKALVDRAIHFRNPDRPPILVLGGKIGKSDVLTYDLSLSNPNNPALSEWGFKRERTPEGAWVIPEEPLLDQWKQVDEYKAPPLNMQRRFSRLGPASRVCGDRYRLARLGLSGYSIYRGLRGARWSGEDFLRDTERFQELMELIFEFETEMFDAIARVGFHGIEFTDDWGERKSSRLTLSLWRKVMRPAYAKQIRRAKELGLHVWFSTSDECVEFFSDLKALGVDVVRVEKPMNLEVGALGRMHRGKVAFNTRVDELLTPGDREASEAQIRNVHDCLAVLTGGFIATIAENVGEERINEITDVLHGIHYLANETPVFPLRADL